MNCKPGDLAIVVRARHTPEMLGRIVTVVRSPVPGELFKTDRGCILWSGACSGLWVVSSNRPMLWKSVDGNNHLALESVLSDECLRPVNPGNLVEAEDQVNKLKDPT